MNQNSLTLFPALLVTAFLPLAHAAPKPQSDSTRELFRDIETSALTAASDADQLNALITLSPASLASRLDDVDALKELVNTMGRDAARLESERNRPSNPEQQAVDVILPLIRACADDTTRVIESFNQDHPSQLRNPEEASLAATIHANSAKIADTLRNCLKLEKLESEKSTVEAGISADRNN